MSEADFRPVVRISGLVVLLSEHFPYWSPCACPLGRRRCYPRRCLARDEEPSE